jgi:hypothetical protein
MTKTRKVATRRGLRGDLRAITIRQPYAELIARGEKLCENRTWPTNYRGRLLIHSGTSRMFDGFSVEVMAPRFGLQVKDLDFGAVVAVADLAACIPLEVIKAGRLPADMKWIEQHEHCHGPYCWILKNVRRMPVTVLVKGQQGIWSLTGNEKKRVEQLLLALRDGRPTLREPISGETGRDETAGLQPAGVG